MSGKLKPDELFVLARAPFYGFPVGSNIWPLTTLDDKVDGEVVEELLRNGFLEALPLDAMVEGERSPDTDYAPDLDFLHQIVITTLGRTAIKQGAGE